MKYKFTFGADPEFFVTNKKTKEVVPACRKFGGEKRAPMFLSPDGGYLEDGTTVEFNVTPSSTLAETRKKIEGLLLVFLNQNDNFSFSRLSHADFAEAELAKYPEAMQIGCSPDLFAYGLRNAPSIARFKNKRFAGGHIHVGINPWPEGLDKGVFIKFMDLAFCCPAVGHFHNSYRWPFYGHPGLYRETDYGVEHRSPDNYWCNPEFYAWCTAEHKKCLDQALVGFDETMSNVKKCLDFDEHGARINHEMTGYIRASRIEDIMTNIAVYDSPSRIANLRGYGSESQHFARRWAKERRIIEENRENIAKANAAAG